MSRRAAILVITLVVVLLAATVGCIEVKEKPPQGPFVIDLETEEMHFVAASHGLLVGPHAHVETEIPHAHAEHSWDIHGLGDFEGAEVELPDHDVYASSRTVLRRPTPGLRSSYWQFENPARLPSETPASTPTTKLW